MWRELQQRAVPLLMLDLPDGARVLDAGHASAGALLTLPELVAESWVADTDTLRLARLRLPVARARCSVRGWITASPASALSQLGALDLLLLSGGVADLEADALVGALNPGAQVVVRVDGLPGTAARAGRFLERAGLDWSHTMVPWPSSRSAAAWVDVRTDAAWSTLQSHFRGSARNSGRRALSRLWREANRLGPAAMRRAFGYASTTAYVVGRR